jgi:hypothetical protein
MFSESACSIVTWGRAGLVCQMVGLSDANLMCAETEMVLFEIEELLRTITNETKYLEKLTDDYGAVINWALAELERDVVVPDVNVERLKAEMTNRLQFFSLLKGFQAEIQQAQHISKDTIQSYARALKELQEIVGRRAAVPKESVYVSCPNLSSDCSSRDLKRWRGRGTRRRKWRKG